MWITCQKCLGDDCLICDAYYYAFGQLERIDLEELPMTHYGGFTDK